MLILERPWTRQPQGAVGVDWGNPLASNLVFSGLPNVTDNRNLVNGQSLTRTGALIAGIGKHGVYHTFSTGNYIDFNPDLCSHTTPTTIAWTQEPRSTSANSTVINWRATGATNSFLIYESIADVDYFLVVGVRNGGFSLNRAFNSVGIPTNNVADAFCLILPSGTSTAANAVLYRNGVPMGGAVADLNNSFASNVNPAARIGALNAGGDPFEGLLGNINIWARALTESEAANWTKNPWQLFAPRKIYIPTAAAAATAPSITALSARLITATSAQPRISYS